MEVELVMLFDYKAQSILRSANDYLSANNHLESYFKSEGLDSLYIFSLLERDRKQQKRNKIKGIRKILTRK